MDNVTVGEVIHHDDPVRDGVIVQNNDLVSVQTAVYDRVKSEFVVQQSIPLPLTLHTSRVHTTTYKTALYLSMIRASPMEGGRMKRADLTLYKLTLAKDQLENKV